jgi:hypothetical protein
MTRAEHIQSYKELIEYFVAASAGTLAAMIRDNPPESQADLWHHAHAAMETAIREHLEKGPTP